MFSGADVLLLEDDALLRRRLAAHLTGLEAEVTAVGTLAEARRVAKEVEFDFALLDVNLPDGISLDLLRAGLFGENTAVVVMTAEGGIKTAVEALRLGAGDYLAKPFEFDALPLAFARCRQARRASRRDDHLAAARTPTQGATDDFFFGSGLESVRAQLEKILAADRRLAGARPAPVLIEGETGTGKTTLARRVHAGGPRAARPLIEVNCSALPENLAESELFGHERGAFTDAKAARIGLFEAADGGTLFLDEIPSLSVPIQAKVLTVLESGRLRRVGGTKEIQVDVRVIAASNADLRAEATAGRFRADLFHRLDLFRLRMPPLRERRADLPELAAHLLAGVARRYRTRPPALSARARRCLATYPWPGNVRELAHELERSLVLHEGEGGLDFPGLPAGDDPQATDSSATGSAPSTAAMPDWLAPGWSLPEEGFELDAAIDRWIALALAETHGNVSAAARRLGVTRDYLRYRRPADPRSGG
jgi:DNA-binding NtrC family response regulator